MRDQIKYTHTIFKDFAGDDGLADADEIKKAFI